MFASRTVNQFTGTVSRFTDNIGLIAPGATGVHPSEIGFTGVRPQTDKFLGVPSLTIGGIRVITGTGSLNAKTTWQIKDDFSYLRGDHWLRLGSESRAFIQNISSANNNGDFAFGSGFTGNPVADFLLGLPGSYTQTSGNTRYPRQLAHHFYLADNWRVLSNLTIDLGVRYELTPPLKDRLDQVVVFRPGQRSIRIPNAPAGLLFPGEPDPVLGLVPRGGYPTDKTDLAPRLAVAYSPKPASGWLRSLLGNGATAIRAGFGLFYDQTFGFSSTQFSHTQPFSVSRTLVFPSPARGTFANPFGSEQNSWSMDGIERGFTGTPDVHSFDPRFRTSYTYQYNLTLQRELPWSLFLEVAYVGNNSFKLYRERELNVAKAGSGATSDSEGLSRSYGHLGSVLSQESTGRARYDSLQVRLSRNFKSGLTMKASYVYGRSFDDGSGHAPRPRNDFFSFHMLSPSMPWARSSFDRTHNFVMTFAYNLPKLNIAHIPGYLVEGWQFAGVTEFRSGLPLNIIQRAETILDGNSPISLPDFVGPYRRLDPREHRTIIVNGREESGHYFFDPNAFRSFCIDPGGARLFWPLSKDGFPH